MKTKLKERISVLKFPADEFSWSEIAVMSDEEKRQFAEDNSIFVSEFDSLDEFQLAVNEDSVDVSQSFIFFVPNKFNAITQEEVDEKFEEIKRDYQKDDICMVEMLASQPADGLTLEQAFNLYMKAKHWADGDTFHIERDGQTEQII